MSSKFLPLVAAVAALPVLTPLSAQTHGIYSNYPDSGLWSSTAIDRGVASQNGNAVELLNEMPQGLIAGLGDTGTRCELQSMLVVIQDEQASTQEQWRMIARSRNAAGNGPDTGTPLFQTGPLSTPSGQSGRQAWIFTVTFATPVAVPCDSWFHGVSLNTAPLWASGADGLSLQMAHDTLAGLGGNPRASAPNLGWSYDATANQTGSHDYVWSVTLNPRAPTLQVGAIVSGSTRTSASSGHAGTSFGNAGFYPDISGQPRSDGLATRISDASNANAVTGVLFSFGPNPTGIRIPGIRGRAYIDLATLLGFPGGTIPAGAPQEVIRTFLPANSLPVSLAGSTVWFQGVVLDPSNGATLTNAVGVRF